MRDVTPETMLGLRAVLALVAAAAAALVVSASLTLGGEQTAFFTVMRGALWVTVPQLALATVGAWRKHGRSADPLWYWVSLAFLLLMFTRLDMAITSGSTGESSEADLLRLTASAFVLIGALREMATYWTNAARSAAAEEGRRLAADLHDGLVQELAYLRRNLTSDAPGPLDPRQVARLADAADRAEERAREVMRTLAFDVDEPFPSRFEREVRDAAGRLGLAVRADVSPFLTVLPGDQEVILRIAVEAITNAARHGDARRVVVSLAARGSGVVMLVKDDGRGFDVAGTVSDGGLRIMGERARDAGGSLRIESSRASGTTVELDL